MRFRKHEEEEEELGWFIMLSPEQRGRADLDGIHIDSPAHCDRGHRGFDANW